MKKDKSVTLAIALALLIVSLFVSSTLVKTSQETRRGAAEGDTTELSLISSVQTPAKIGDEREFEIWMHSMTKKIDFVQATICYNSSIVDIDTASTEAIHEDVNPKFIANMNYFVDAGGNSGIVKADIVKEIGTTECLVIVLKSELNNNLGEIKSGKMLIGKVKFKAVGAGTNIFNLRLEKKYSYGSGPDGLFLFQTATAMGMTVQEADKKYKHATTASATSCSNGKWICTESNDGTGVSKEACEAEAGCKYSRDCDRTTGKYKCTFDNAGTFSTETLCLDNTDQKCYISYSHGSLDGDCDKSTGDWKCIKDIFGGKTEAQCKADIGCDTENKFSRGSCNKTTGKFACVQDNVNGTYTSQSACETDVTKCFITYSHTGSTCDKTTGDWQCLKDATGTMTETQCKVDTGCDTENKFSKGVCNKTTGKFACVQDNVNGTYTSQSACEDDTGCDVEANTGFILKFKIAYPGIGTSSIDKCITDLNKVDIKVMAMVDSGTTKVAIFKDVVVTKTTETAKRETADISVYKGQVVFPVDFAYSDKLTVYITGRRHLSVKYGRDKQASRYKGIFGYLGGLKTNASDTPEFDFSQYPLVAGDLEIDDAINVLDFSKMKGEMGSTEEKYYVSDLNGDCRVNSVDSAYFFASLKDKEGQLE